MFVNCYALNVFIFPNCFSQNFCTENEEIGRERAALPDPSSKFEESTRRFLWLCWFGSLVGLRQLSSPCHFFWVYLNVRTCNSFSVSLARVLRFIFCLISLGSVVFFILRHGWVWQIPIRGWAPFFVLHRIIFYVNTWYLCLYLIYYLYSKLSDFCFTANCSTLIQLDFKFQFQ